MRLKHTQAQTQLADVASKVHITVARTNMSKKASNRQEKSIWRMSRFCHSAKTNKNTNTQGLKHLKGKSSDVLRADGKRPNLSDATQQTQFGGTLSSLLIRSQSDEVSTAVRFQLAAGVLTTFRAVEDHPQAPRQQAAVVLRA